MKKIVLLLLITGFFTKPALAQLPDFTQTDCNGVSHRLYDDLAAGNAVVLKFCAGWCVPCVRTNPLYQELWQEIGADCHIKMYAMLFETGVHGEPTNTAYGIDYANHYGLTMPLLADIGTFYTGLTGQYNSTYGMDAIPTTFIIIPNQQAPANSTVRSIVGAYENLGQMIKDSLALGGYNVASLTFTGELCTNTPSATLTSSSPTGNLWSTGQVSQSITVNQSDVYTLTASINGCTTTATKTVEFNPLPVVGTATISNASMCQDGIFYLNYSLPPGSPSDLMWLIKSSAAGWEEFIPVTVGPTLMYAFRPSGTELQFMVRATNSNGSCPAFSNQVSVTVSDPSSTNIPGTASASSTAVCPGNGFTLYYSGGVPGSYWEIYQPLDRLWYPFAEASQPVNPLGQIQLMALGNYDIFRVISPNGDCYSVSNTVQVNYFALPGTPVAGPAFSCGGVDITLHLEGNYSNILWSTGASTSSITVNPTVTTEYLVTATDVNGCTNSGGHIVTVGKEVKPVINANTNGGVCPSAPVTLSFAGTNSASPCAESVFGQWPLDAYTPLSCNGVAELITSEGYFGEYSMVNVEAGNYYKFTSSGFNHIMNTITNSEGSQVYANGDFRAIWKASYSGQVRFYTHGVDCSPSGDALIDRSVACYTDPSLLGSFLWMPGGQTTAFITVSPATSTNYSLTFTEAPFPGCATTVTKQIIVGIGAVELSTTNIACNSATLNWNTAIDPTLWQLEYKSTANGSKWINVPVPNASTRSATITGLKINQNYNWHIRAKCGNSWTLFSATVPFRTLTTCTTSSNQRTTMGTPAAEEKPSDLTEGLKVVAMPNPSNTNFRIVISGKNLKEPVQLIVTDILGRVIEARITNAGQIIAIGDKYKSGTYIVKIIQGNEIRQTKLIKLAN